MGDFEDLERLKNRWYEPEPDPEPVTHCEYCGAELYDGDTFYDVSGDVVCQNCIDSMARTVFAENFE